LLIALLAAALGGLPAAAAPFMYLDVAGQGDEARVDPEKTFTVTVWADDIPEGGDGRGMFGFGFTASFAATGFTGSTPVADSQWTGGSDASYQAGWVKLTANREGEASGPFGDDIRLGSFDLTSKLQAGLFSLTLTHWSGPGDNVLFDTTDPDWFLDSDPAFFRSAQIEVIPEPGVRTLLVAGLGLLGAFRRVCRA
jgi:hypothetical protein